METDLFKLLKTQHLSNDHTCYFTYQVSFTVSRRFSCFANMLSIIPVALPSQRILGAAWLKIHPLR